MKYKIGDRVLYHHKVWDLKVLGTVIATDPYWNEMIIEVEIVNKPHWSIGIRSVWMGGEGGHRLKFNESSFGPNHWNERDTLKDSIRIGARSKCVRYAEVPYDPTQQGDTDDDI